VTNLLPEYCLQFRMMSLKLTQKNMSEQNRNYVLIDTSQLQLISSPGLNSPKESIDYYVQSVQQILSECFQGIFPNIVQSQEGLAYQLVDNGGLDRCSRSVPANSISDIPKGEVMKLMEGWIRLRRHMQGEFSKTLKSILLNFRVPDPQTSIQFYRIEQFGGQTKLLIFWGYQSIEKPCIPIEKALSQFLDVTTGHLQSILSTSIPATLRDNTSLVKISTDLPSQISQEEGKKLDSFITQEPKKSNATVPLLVCCGVLLAVVVFFGAHYFGKDPQDSGSNKDIADNTLIKLKDTSALPKQGVEPEEQAPAFPLDKGKSNSEPLTDTQTRITAPSPPKDISKKMPGVEGEKEQSTSDLLSEMLGVSAEELPSQEVALLAAMANPSSQKQSKAGEGEELTVEAMFKNTSSK
jgi:hypothetical protein